ncbi:MAG TPA: hypothetical protein VM513_12865 [Kofleriaceae bacterium]|nr:hypothetical protein [Kofleriaceae bacterium]
MRSWILFVFTIGCGGGNAAVPDGGADADVDGRSTLRILVEGSGQGSVEIDGAPACTSDCTSEHATGAQVTLVAAPAAGSAFGGWEGACAGADPSVTVTVTVSSDITCTARFLTRYTLSVTSTGGVTTIASAPAGIACPDACSAELVDGTSVTLTATPERGTGVVAWHGDCQGSAATTTVEMTGNKSCEVELAWSSAHWARTYGTNLDNRAYAALATSDGGYIAAGYTGAGAGGLHDGLVVKVDAAGAPRWQHRYGTVNKDELEDIVELPGGGYLAVGRTYAAGRDMDVWILRLDANGQILGQTTYGAVGDETIHGITLTSATTAILVGEHANSGLVLGIDVTTGAVVWSKLVRTGTTSMLDAVTTLGNGNVVAVGATNTSAWMLELTSTGSFVRERSIGTNAAFTAVERNGTGWIAGGSLLRTTGTYSDGWLVSFDAAGAISWQKTYSWGETVHDIAAASSGFVIAGQSQRDGVADLWSGWLLGVDATGGVRFERQYGSPSANSSGMMLAVATGSGERVLGAGYHNGWGAGSSDAWIASVDAMGAIGGQVCPSYVAATLTSTVATPSAASTTTTATETALTSPTSATGAATLDQLNGTIENVCFD